jgi:hypothetical protein
MKTPPEQIVAILSESPGLTDREITDVLHSPNHPTQSISIAARSLAKREIVLRARRSDGRIGNVLTGMTVPPT